MRNNRFANTAPKTAKTIKPYTVKYLGYEITIPIGSAVSNQTALGHDDDYRFWRDFSAEAKRLTGFDKSILHHDLTHYGLNIPAEFCEPYAPARPMGEGTVFPVPAYEQIHRS